MSDRATSAPDVDVVVIGSGAGGLTAGLAAALDGARVLVLEKAADIGGATAVSGGAAWIPCNSLMPSAGVTDSAEMAETYIRGIVGKRYDAEMVGAFLKNGPAMISDLADRSSAVRFESYPGSDYHPELAGASPKARSLMAAPYDGRRLGAWLGRMRRPMRELTVFGGMMVDAGEALDLQFFWKRWRSFKVTVKLLTRYAMDRVTHGRGTRLIRGQALTARLIRSAVDAGVQIRTHAAVSGFVREDGVVVGVTLPDGEVIRARGGVVLATGGFSANAEMVASYFPSPAGHVCMMPQTNVGDGIRMAEAVGARFGLDNADNGIWMPGTSHVRPNGDELRYPHFAFDRCKPGALIVDTSGRRFVNEAAPYHLVVRAMNARRAQPAWLIGDKRFLRRYGMGLARPAPYPYRSFVEEGYLIEGSSLEALATKIGIDAGGLHDTVQRMNRFAETGVDEDFAKGADPFTRALGDAEHRPNPCVGRVGEGPYFALALYSSDCGTTLGLDTDTAARVRTKTGEAIPGLYACGLDMNSVLRGNYPGAGTMIGPAMTFGWVAGRDAAARAKLATETTAA